MQRWGAGRFGPALAMRLGAAILIAALAGPAGAQDPTAPPAPEAAAMPDPDPALRRGPVVVELYTAQGCSACPPADRMLAELARRPEVIALALHVDYWDYIGWADVFADPEHAERQKRYARARGLNTIYTPQVVVMGVELLEGFRSAEVEAAIAAHLSAPREAELSLSRTPDGRLTIRGEPVAPPLVIASRATGLSLGGMTALAPGAGANLHDVQIVRYLPHAQVEITDGENAGLTADYVNIVTAWQPVGTWDLSGPLWLEVPIAGEEPVVVLVQEAGQGAIVAAARLE
jgi:hypothetical protein